MVAVQAYDDFDEALALANDTRYGLQAGVFTRDLGKALLATEVLEFGAVLINEVPTWRADHMPYGGVRDSRQRQGGPVLRRPGDDRTAPGGPQPVAAISGLGGAVGLVVEPVVQTFECGPAQMLGCIEPMGGLEVCTKRVVIIEGVVVVLRRPFLGDLDLLVG